MPSNAVLSHTNTRGGRLLTAAEAAERLRVSTWRLYDMVREGMIPAVRLGRSVRVDPGALEDFIANGGTASDS